VSSAEVADALNRVLAADETLAQYAWLV
jgi:hypothetical protein